jgi:hypothetical protein
MAARRAFLVICFMSSPDLTCVVMFVKTRGTLGDGRCCFWRNPKDSDLPRTNQQVPENFVSILQQRQFRRRKGSPGKAAEKVPGGSPNPLVD